jgi:hypothetical protein
MKPLLKLTACSLLVWIIIWSCKKEKTEPISHYHPPVANAGTDQTITLPNNSVKLDGSRSADPDNNIAVYQWAKISGPATYNITNASEMITEVNNLVEGWYQFELTVKDQIGLRSKDTVSIVVLVYGSLISTSFTEEFDTVYNLESKGWVKKDNSAGITANWVQGRRGVDKAGVWYGFPAYSFTNSQDEFVYASIATGYYPASNYAISSWLITPILSIKNGDKFSFYSRSDSGVYNDRLQVLMNASPIINVETNYSSVGNFTIKLLDINEAQVANGYPKVWTKYEYIFSGISSQINTRIAFRYFVPIYKAKGIGIDLFKFEKF